jgi:HEAT repeat protein
MVAERERLLHDLQKSFSRAQRRAEEGLVRLGDEAVDGVAAVLFSASADVYTRSFACRVLERIGTPRVVPHLLRVVQEARDSSYAAARFLARRRDPAIVASLLEIAKGADRHAAAAALTGLGECDDRRALPDLLDVVATRRDEAREDAIAAAGKLGGPRALGAIVPMLHDSDAAVRRAVADALTAMQHPDAARHLARALGTETAAGSIKRLTEDLIQLAAVEYVPVMFDAMKRLPDRTALPQMMATFPGAAPADVARYLTESDANIRTAAAIVLGNSRRKEAVAPLLAAKGDADRGVRAAVRHALQRLRRAGIPVSIPPMPLRDRAAIALEWLAIYFRVPSREGFSAYRTGWIAHMVFSAIVAVAIQTMASRMLGLAPGPAIGLALAGVLLLWGVGVLVGILSHYNPLIMIAAIVVMFAGPLLSPSMVLGLLIAALGHVLMIPFSLVLRRAKDALN